MLTLAQAFTEEGIFTKGGGFIVHFFSEEKVEFLAKGYEVVEIIEFEEGLLPRKQFRATMRKRV